MDDGGYIKRAMEKKFKLKGGRRRSRNRLMDNVTKDMKEFVFGDCKEKTKNMKKWSVIVSDANGVRPCFLSKFK